MALMVSRAEIEAARHRRCAWSAPQLAAAIAARFPGNTDIDLADLVAAWLADNSLPRSTLAQCSMIASRLARRGPAPPPPAKYWPSGSYMFPRKALERIAASLP